jgi:hypothetical protein
MRSYANHHKNRGFLQIFRFSFTHTDFGLVGLRPATGARMSRAASGAPVLKPRTPDLNIGPIGDFKPGVSPFEIRAA